MNRDSNPTFDTANPIPGPRLPNVLLVNSSRSRINGISIESMRLSGFSRSLLDVDVLVYKKNQINTSDKKTTIK